MIHVVIAKVQESATNGQRRREHEMMKAEIERINLTHGLDFPGMINIISTKPWTPYGIYFSNQDMDRVLEPHSDLVIIEVNIHG